MKSNKKSCNRTNGTLGYYAKFIILLHYAVIFLGIIFASEILPIWIVIPLIIFAVFISIVMRLSCGILLGFERKIAKYL